MKTLLKIIKNQSFFPLKSRGQSMFPLLQDGDIVYFKKVHFAKIEVNDIIIFQQKNQIICHRVIYLAFEKGRVNYLITKGDNTAGAFEKVTPKQILGKVYQVKRNGQIFNPQTLYLIQSTHYFNEITKIKNEFDQQKINYLFLKGLPLHLYFESNHPQRIYADCDVLVEEKDFESAQKILFQFGYKKFDASLSFLQKKIKKKEVENAYWKIINDFTVIFDLHTEVVFMLTQLNHLEFLYPQKLIKQLTEEFLKTKKKVFIQDTNFYFLSTHFQILYLVLHLFHHNFQGAFRYQFIDKIIRKKKFTPTSIIRLIKIIKKYHLENFVYPSCFLLKKYYQTPLPKDFLIKIKPSSLTFKIYFQTFLKKTNIFQENQRIKAGVIRFLNLFILSPNPIYQKILVFFNPQVVFAVIFVLYHKIRKLNIRVFSFKL